MTLCMICKQNEVLGIIAVTFPDTPVCRDCIHQLNRLFTGCKTEEERMARLELVLNMFKVVK